MKSRSRNRKGILLTLATVVLFVLMLAELITYVTLNINYNVLVSSSSSVSGGASAMATLNFAASSFLHQSLQNALSSLIQFEGTPILRKDHFINNTSYMLQSLMYNGTIANAVSIGNFDGQSSYINVGNHITASPLPQITITAWIYRFAPASGGQDHIFSNWVSSYHFILNSNKVELDLWSSGGKQSPALDGATTIQNNKWYFIAGTFDGTTMTVYVNGVVDGSTASFSGNIISASTSNTNIGAGGAYPPTWANYLFNGIISNVQLYNTALSVTQIANLYNGGIGGSPIVPANNIGWWPLNGDANDNSGNGNSGVATNVVFSSSVQYTSPAMLNSTLSAFLNRISNQITNEGFNVLLTNGTLNVFQNSPFTINANYTALAVINSTRGLFTFPLAATASVSLSGAQSLYGIEAGDPFIIKPMSSYPKAVLIGNVLASSGNMVYNSFSYGTVLYVPGTPTCASVQSQYWSANYILVTPNAMSIPNTICNMGGLVTYALNGVAPGAPYLVYASSSNIMNTVQTGTSVLLSGRGLSLLNISALQSAIQNSYSFASPYTPAYLDWAQGSLTQRSTNGMFSFDLLNRQIASFNGASSKVNIGNPSVLNIQSGVTIAAWIEQTVVESTNYPVIAGKTDTAGNGQYALRVDPDNHLAMWGYVSSDVVAEATGSNPLNVWEFVVGTYDGSNLRLYINGVFNSNAPLTGSLTLPSPANVIIGADNNGQSARYFPGQIAGVQIYSTVLTSSQITQLYQEGIDSIPISNAGLVGWWPLNGDFNDYSGDNDSGIATSVMLNQLSDYQGDPIRGGSLYTSNALNETEGVMNCGTLAQCNNPYLGHLYLANVSLSGAYAYALNESAALGLANSVIQK